VPYIEGMEATWAGAIGWTWPNDPGEIVEYGENDSMPDETPETVLGAKDEYPETGATFERGVIVA